MAKSIKVKLVAFHVTASCTHRCPMCYIDASKKTKKDTNIDIVMNVARALVSERIEEVTLLGGDPAKYSHCLKLAKYFSENNITVSILSNTLQFKKSELQDAVRYIDSFEGTIHSDKSKLHDEFCQCDGAFDLLTKNMKYFSDKQKTIGIAINVAPLSYASIYNIVDILINTKKINLSYLIIQRIIPMGRATSLSDFLLNREQVIRALNEVIKIENDFKINIIIEDPVPLCILPTNLSKYISTCQWGISKASINAKGDLSRCGADPRYRLGNILEKSLHDIWNSSDILKSFRDKSYLPGRCQACNYLTQCGGGCSLSCELEKDHGIDYMFSQYEKMDKEIHGDLCFEQLKESELSSVLQIEWYNFPGFGHVFSVDSLKYWYKHNPKMFWVVKDRRNWIMGYAVIVPITNKLYRKICKGDYSSLLNFPVRSVLTHDNSLFYHIEVIATIYRTSSSRPGSFLIKKIGETMIDKKVTYITTSPIKDIGVGLCNYFGFKHIADEHFHREIYPIYNLEVNHAELSRKVKRF